MNDRVSHAALRKKALRSEMRRQRREFASSTAISLMFSRIPNIIMPLLDKVQNIALYAARDGEVHTQGYALALLEMGKTLALPCLTDRDENMSFRRWSGVEEELIEGPFGIAQPPAEQTPVTPDLLFMPLLGFDDKLNRLGQGGGHYDRYCARHPDVVRIGLAWSVQQLDQVPVEPHDLPLHAVITESRIFAGDEFDALSA